MNPDSIFNIQSEAEFNQLAIEIFNCQYGNTEIYKEFVDLIGKTPEQIKHYKEIPFLPISFFKNKLVLNKNLEPLNYFQSSGTTKKFLSKHYFQTPEIYKKSLMAAFRQFIGDPENMMILGLLPNYQENPHSSLIFMVDELIKKSKYEQSGYFLNNDFGLDQILSEFKNTDIPIVLFGVSFALLDFIENRQINNENLTIIETGGMKGRKKEVTKEEVLNQLRIGFPNAKLGSEYGMTELFSQAYAMNSLSHHSPSWMKILIRELDDPQSISSKGTGAINIIDLANLNSCSFIATDDLGKLHGDGTFEILGRMDHSDVRGCSLLLG